METPAVPSLLPHLWKSTLASGILALALGGSVLVWPTFTRVTILVAAIIFGVYLLITGVTQVFFAFSLHVTAGGRVLSFISGAASLVLALLCFRSLYNSVVLLGIWIGIGFIFRGVATTVSAISDPTLPARGWETFIGVISLLAGMVMIASPIESLEVLALVVGIWLVVIGMFEIVSSFRIRDASKALARAVSGRASA